jgi:hypothetical protein
LQSTLAPVEEFILDCADLASSLDSLNLGDDPLNLMAAADIGRVHYESLQLQRQQDLSPSIVEEGWVDFMLDNVRARLEFIEARVEKNLRGAGSSNFGPRPGLVDPGGAGYSGATAGHSKQQL